MQNKYVLDPASGAYREIRGIIEVPGDDTYRIISDPIISADIDHAHGLYYIVDAVICPTGESSIAYNRPRQLRIDMSDMRDAPEEDLPWEDEDRYAFYRWR